jgi:Cyclic nucleotide-binding domain/Major Facilitator Superfamily
MARFGSGLRESLRAAAATPALRRLQLGWLLSSIGGWAFMVTLALYAFDRGGAVAVGLAAAARMIPAGIAAPFTGLLADRRGRRDVLLVSTAARAGLVGIVALCAAGGASLALMLPLAAIFTAASTAHRPAQAALLPTLARNPRELSAGNAATSVADNAGFLIGALAAGIVVGSASAQAAFAGIAVAFALATAALAGLSRDAVPEHRERDRASSPTRELLLGVRTLAGTPSLRLVGGTLTALALAEGAIDVLVVVTALSVLDTGDAGVGVLNSAWGVGGIVGGAAALRLLTRSRLGLGLATGGLLIAASLVALAALPRPGLAAALLAVLGVGYALLEVAGLTLVQRLTSDEVLGRVFGTLETGYWIATGAGALAAPAAVALLGDRGAVAATGLAVALLFAALWRALVRLGGGGTVDGDEVELLRRLPIFAALPLADVETLALRVLRMRVAAGELLCTQGEPGDRFYVVAEGSVEVVRDGVRRAVIERGGGFGEVALLRDSPRIATVRALEPGRLLALDREAFIDTVVKYPRAQQAAGRIVDLHLEGAPA